MRISGIASVLVVCAVLTGCETLAVQQTPVGVDSGYISQRNNLICKKRTAYPASIVKVVGKYVRSGKSLTVENYETIGNVWGVYMAEVAKLDPNVNNEKNDIFSCFLFGEDISAGLSFDYFGIHRDMKKAFQAGFREGYAERNSDLVLGVNLNEAARLKSQDSAVRLMDVYREKIIADVMATSRFKREWGQIMDETLGTFEEITAEGSPAESRAFLSSFPNEYESELKALTDCLERNISCDLRPSLKKRKSENELSAFEINEMLAEGFSRKDKDVKILNRSMHYELMTVHINDEDRPENTYFRYSSSKRKNRSAPMMISDANVVNQILKGDSLAEQINKISWLYVGQEMGRKFNHNLISRQELIEWIKRARSIMESKSGDNYYDTSIRLLREGFQDEETGYGPGGETEWKRIKKETGLSL